MIETCIVHIRMQKNIQTWPNCVDQNAKTSQVGLSNKIGQIIFITQRFLFKEWFDY